MIKDKGMIHQFGQMNYYQRTKDLAHHLSHHPYVLLNHEDIDEMAALLLIKKKVKAVLNYAASMTGNYPSLGTIKLREAKIPVYDIQNPQKVSDLFQSGDHISIIHNQLWVHKEGTPYFVSLLIPYTASYIDQKLKAAKVKGQESLKSFAQNTLHFAQKEMNEILKPIPIPKLKLSLDNKHVVIVTRGSGYIEDLRTLKQYIRDQEPILIGVDGGADAILECGYQPDIVIGDMDSVSGHALSSGAEVIVHAYPDGHAPGLAHLHTNNIPVHIFPCFGTSEDAAQLFAYEAGASLIVSLGSHTNMVDFLEKGRKGMGSTLLVRLKIGDKLVDAKGVRLLYPEKNKPRWQYMSKLRSIFS